MPNSQTFLHLQKKINDIYLFCFLNLKFCYSLLRMPKIIEIISFLPIEIEDEKTQPTCIWISSGHLKFAFR